MPGLSQKATSVGDWSERRECPSTLAVIFGLIWFCLAWAELGVVDMLHNPWVPAALAGTAFILALSRLRFFSQCAPLLYIGQRTIPIYLLHAFLCRRDTQIMGINNIAIIMPIAFLYNIALPIAVFEMARRLRIPRVLRLG
jgi:fucose 4-O-acetylase-like acetyltransferase